MKRILFLLMLISMPLLAKEAIILQSRSAGMFSIWMDVLTLCREYELQHLKGIQVDFGMTGNYYCASHGPIHCLGLDGYQLGKEALIDMILLSRGNHLIRMSSNLSKWSTWWNPNIPVTELNKRHGF